MRIHSSCLAFLSLGLLATASSYAQDATEPASYVINTTVKFNTDVRNRGISDSLQEPGGRVNVEVAHESGLVGSIEVATVSTKEFLNGTGQSAVLGVGWRTGNPDAWHYGVGAAAEIFPGASVDTPHSFDPNTFATGDTRTTKYDSTFFVLELGYKALETRLLTIVSDTYRGIDTGTVCGTYLNNNMLNEAVSCYARGDNTSRGSTLFDIDYKIPVASATTLNLHAGYQRVKNFQEADLDDYSVGITHKRWGTDFTLEWITTRVKEPLLYLYADGNSNRTANNDKLVLTIAHKF